MYIYIIHTHTHTHIHIYSVVLEIQRFQVTNFRLTNPNFQKKKFLPTKIFRDTNCQSKYIPGKCCEMWDNTMNFGILERYCILSFCSCVEAGASFLYFIK